MLDSATSILAIQEKDSLLYGIIQHVRSEAKSNNFMYIHARSYLLEGRYFFAKQMWDSVLFIDNKAYELGLQLQDKKERADIISRSLSHIADVNSYMGDYATSLDYTLRALQVMDSSGLDNKVQWFNMYKKLSSIYRKLQKYDISLEYIQKASTYESDMSGAVLLGYYAMYFDLLMHFNEKKEAWSIINLYENYISKNNNLLSETDNRFFRIKGYRMYAGYALKYNKDFNEALSYYQKSLKFAAKNSYLLATIHSQIGMIYDSMGKYEEALHYTKKSLDVSVEKNLNSQAYKNARRLAGIYARLNKFDYAYHYENLSLRLKDSINQEERIKEYLFLEAKYQNQKKESEIVNLQHINKKHEALILQKNRVLLLGSLVVIAILIIFVLIYMNIANRKHLAVKEKNMQEEKVKILEKKQEIIALQSMLNGQDEERSRIAKDLHDSLGGLFSTLKMYLNALEDDYILIKENKLFKKSKILLGDTSDEVRRIAHNMMPEVLMKFGLLESVNEYVNNVNAGGKVRITLQHFGMETERLPIIFEQNLYRVVQELINNIIKHSKAKEVIIQFVKNEKRLSIVIEDNGQGFDTQDLLGKKTGLDSVKNRVKYLNGKMIIESEKGIGTTVMIDFLIH